MTSRWNWITRLVAGSITQVLATVLVLGMVSCATRESPAINSSSASTSVEAEGQSPGGTREAPGNELPNAQRLEALWQRRTGNNAEPDFSLGAGDELEISVPLEQLEHREVRVSPQGTIDLPLVGSMQVTGLTERALTDELRARLSRYMYDPPVSLFVKHYGSREVAVVGAVEKPGLYTLKSGSDTLMEMISRAGGAAKDSAANIIFVPAEDDHGGLERASIVDVSQTPAVDASEKPVTPSGRDKQIEVAKVGAVLADAPDSPRPHASRPGLSAMAIAKLNPIEISMTDPATQPYLGLPARPGDVLIIPAAGEVTVGGWVQNPGAYKITPGMTALSALSAAGGPMFSSSAQILRTAKNGERLSIPIDIPKVRRGERSDVPMESGDVIMVDKSIAGAVPYAAYELFTKFGTGMFMPVP